MTPPIDDIEALRQILANTDALLLDFDGPICSVFAGIPAPTVAGQLRDVLAEGGYVDLPGDVRNSADPFDVFFYAAKLGRDEARYVEAAFRAHEVEAMQSAEPTSETVDLVRAWKATGRALAVVSNNSVAAVEAYLDIHEIRAEVDFVSARVNSDAALLKPSPFLVLEAVKRLAVPAPRCVLVGDSVTDIQAARSAHVVPVGYANKSGKTGSLAAAGVDLVITDMGLMLAVLRPT